MNFLDYYHEILWDSVMRKKMYRWATSTIDPTICIFRCNNVSESDVETHFVDAFGIKPVSTTKVTGPKASRIYVRCSAALYKLLPIEKRLRILWESLTFDDAVNPRFCRKCQRFGHVDKFCRAEEHVVDFVKTHKDTACTNCLHSLIAKQCQYKDISKNLADKELIGKFIESVDRSEFRRTWSLFFDRIT